MSTEQNIQKPAASPKELELLRIMADYSEPQPAKVLARIIRYRGGATASVVYDRLVALDRKGFVELCGDDWAYWWRITESGRKEIA